MKRLKIKTANGFEFEVTGKKHTYNAVDKIHYLDADSYPDEIVESVEDEKWQ